jgi:hypothetical protein
MDATSANLSRRKFLASGAVLISGFVFDYKQVMGSLRMDISLKEALIFTHFPDTLHAFIWRNWQLVPLGRLAEVVKAKPGDLNQMAKVMGLPPQLTISNDQQQRSYLTIIRRNWHLLPREQLLALLGWTDEKLDFTLQEDDFFYIKLGSLKPVCINIQYNKESIISNERIGWIKKVLQEEFPGGIPKQQQPLFSFVKELTKPSRNLMPKAETSGFSPRFGFSYFALFGDPLLKPDIDPLPDGYLEKMVASGMDSTWIHIVLSKITPFPWDEEVSEDWQTRLNNLEKLVARAKSKGIGIFLYLNEPRNLPLRFFDKYPKLKGIVNGNHASLCTSNPEVQRYLVDSLAMITESIPDLAGFFSITASENHTNCWSHWNGNDCPRCAKRNAASVISELNGLFQQGIEQGIKSYEIASKKSLTKMPQLIVWDWGWPGDWAKDIIPLLPKQSALMSVSEWDLEINRGGIKNGIGEYSISAIGPGPRALRNWEIARQHGLKTIAKIQAGNTWEIAAVPYIPALENVAIHAANLRDVGVQGMMLGWTLGGYPSPNLEVVAAIGNDPSLSSQQAMDLVADKRYGIAGKSVVKAWKKFSHAFREYPFGGGLYFAPLQAGPSNLLWEQSTGYAATMVGLPYDQLTAWTGNYPVHVFINQMDKLANGFDQGLQDLRNETSTLALSIEEHSALKSECSVAEAIAIHCHSTSNQALFINLRDQLLIEKSKTRRIEILNTLASILHKEIDLAKRMHTLQCRDSRLGYESSNHYFYTPDDLLEKVLNCRDLLDRWIKVMRLSC